MYLEYFEYLVVCVLASSFFYFNYKSKKHQPIKYNILKHSPRRFRKWKRYNKKDKWIERYTKYLMKCRMNNTKPHNIPTNRITDIKPGELNTLQEMCISSVNVNELK